MYVKRLVLRNVRAFPGEHVYHFDRGLNYFVGDNNCGKSTVLEALAFLSGERVDQDSFTSVGVAGFAEVEAVLAGALLPELLEDDRFKNVRSYMREDASGEPTLRVRRSFEPSVVTQGNRTVNIDHRKIQFWSEERQQFENPTGIDALFKALISFEPVWADTVPGDYSDFGSTKTLGRLLESVVAEFSKTEKWGTLQGAHADVFGHDGEGSFGARTVGITRQISDLISEQYGHSEVTFKFTLPDPSVFFKVGQVLVGQGESATPLGDNGTGMQRVFAMAVIQVYARMLATSQERERPLVLMLDEPETWLHPRAQIKLAKALTAVAERQQVFLVTHSPYMLRSFVAGEHDLIVFRSGAEGREIQPAGEMGIILQGSPTWGEINFHAFGIATVEFHNELYGHLQWLAERAAGKELKEKAIDEVLFRGGAARDKVWIRSPNFRYTCTLSVYVRNCIHHPENDLNAPYTEAELEESIGILIQAVRRLSADAGATSTQGSRLVQPV